MQKQKPNMQMRPNALRCFTLRVVILSLLGPAQGLASEPNKDQTAARAIKTSPAHPAKQQLKKKRKRKKKISPDPQPNRQLVLLAEGPGFKVMDLQKAWGTFTAVTRLQEVFAAYHKAYPDDQPLYVHDLSRKRGGRLAPHSSHRRGRDVDIRIVLNPPSEKYSEASLKTLDVERNWFLINAFVQTNQVEYIFLDYRLQKPLYNFAKEQGVSDEDLSKIFQYPHRSRSRMGIVRHEPGHKNHIHVRFLREKPEQPLVL
jgi:hypothetical protein